MNLNPPGHQGHSLGSRGTIFYQDLPVSARFLDHQVTGFAKLELTPPSFCMSRVVSLVGETRDEETLFGLTVT